VQPVVRHQQLELVIVFAAHLHDVFNEYAALRADAVLQPLPLDFAFVEVQHLVALFPAKVFHVEVAHIGV